MALEQILRIDFGKGGNSEIHVGEGWSLAEKGYRWMVGPISELKIGPVADVGNVVLVIDIEPFVRPPVLPAQNLTISIGGIPFVHAEVGVGGTFGYIIPPELLAGNDAVVLVFDHPNAARPSDVSTGRDHRQLAFSMTRLELHRLHGAVGGSVAGSGRGIAFTEIERRAGISAETLVTAFESLGDNCEFGLMQRRCGAEPLSLLRFANTLLPSLLRGLHSGFAGLGALEDLVFRLEGKTKAEYIIQEQAYGLTYHTFRYKGEIDEEKFVASESARLKFLVRKFVEDLKSGEKIFVCKRNSPLRLYEILPILTALGVYGDNCLLWVVPADAAHPPGKVEWAAPGLIKGFIDRFAPNENAHDLSLDVWLELCVNALELRRNNAGSLAGTTP